MLSAHVDLNVGVGRGRHVDDPAVTGPHVQISDKSAHDARQRRWDRIFSFDDNATSVQACLWEVPVSAVADCLHWARLEDRRSFSGMGESNVLSR